MVYQATVVSRLIVINHSGQPTRATPMTRSAASFTYSTRALVLRSRPLGEKDRLLTLFSPERGRISAVAKGARGTRSKLASASQPYILGRFMLAKGRSLDIVTQVQIEEPHAHLAGDLLKAGWAACACELAGAVAEELPDAEGWQILAVTLAALNDASDDGATEATGAWMEIQWLRHQGYAPTVGVCVDCGNKISASADSPDSRVAFSARHGGTLCSACRHTDSSVLVVSAAALRAMHRLERSLRPPPNLGLAPSPSGELFVCLARSLAQHLEGRLRSRDFLEEVRAARALGRSPATG